MNKPRGGHRRGGCLLGAMLLCLQAFLPQFQPPARAEQALTAFAHWTLPLSEPPRAILAGELDGDGQREIVVVGREGFLALLEADGTVVWQSQLDEAVNAACLADLDGDKRMELVLGGPRGITTLSSEGQALWFHRTGYGIDTVTAKDVNGDGRDEVMAATEYEHVYLLAADGNAIWHYWSQRRGFGGTVTGLAVGDLDGDGRYEIAAGFDFPGYKDLPPSGHVLLLDDDGQEVWRRQEESAVLCITTVDPDGDGRPLIAAGTADGRFLVLYADSTVRWQHELGSAVLHVLGRDIDDDGQEEVVAVARDHLLALDDDGSPLWERSYAHSTVHAVLGDFEGSAGRLVAVLSLEPGLPRSSVELINVRGGTEESYLLPEVASSVLLRDLNMDGWAELLIASEEGVQLLSRARGAAHTRVAWRYQVRGEITAVHAADLDGDRQLEILLGSADRNLYVLNDDGTLSWRYSVDGGIRTVGSGDVDGDGQREAIVGFNRPSERGESQLSGVVVLRGDGRVLWSYDMEQSLWLADSADLDGDHRQEVILGAGSNQVLAMSDGKVAWMYATQGSILSLLGVDVDGDGRAEVAVGSEDNHLYLLDGDGSLRWQVDAGSDVRAVCSADLDGDGLAEVIAAVEGGSLLAFHADGSLLWDYNLRDSPLALQVADTDGDGRIDVVTATGEGGLYVVSGRGFLLWRYEVQARLLAMAPGDVDGDSHSEVVAGSTDGVVYVVTYGGQLEGRHELGGVVAALWVGDVDGDGRAEILSGSRDGQLYMYEHMPNRAPLVANPSVARAEAGYVYSVSVDDPEDDRVEVTLKVRDPFSGAWHSAGTKYALAAGTLYWFVDPFPLLASGRMAAYSLTYSDNLNHGTLPLMVGPRIPGFPWYTYAALLAVVGLLLVGYRVWSVSPRRKARMLYAQLASSPQDLPGAVRQLALSRANSAETLIRLSQRARSVGDKNMANLAEGYLLLSSRPAAGLQVIAAALTHSVSVGDRGKPAAAQLVTLYELLADLLDANSLGRILVLRPRLQRFLRQSEARRAVSPPQGERQQAHDPSGDDGATQSVVPGEIEDALTQFLRVMGLLHGSERAELVEDKLDYLGQAAQTLAAMEDGGGGPEDQVIAQIAREWKRVIVNARQEWQGRAQLRCRLRTKRVVAAGEAVLLLEVQNRGRSPATDSTVELTGNGSYSQLGSPVALGSISPGQTRQVELRLSPPAEDSFRVEFLLRYNDQEARGQTQLFADMVQVLRPSEFHVIPNPYVPGRPLGPASPVFFGRDDVFDFVAENARGLLQRNILILIGQRRTGKTSMLLQLPVRLSDEFVAVYLDCQSLGLTPGLSAWLYDVATTIADGVGERGIQVVVPGLAAFEQRPARVFEHEFLKPLQAALGERTLLLVLDEFEELEGRVRGGRLEPTLFPYLRHLMQHTHKLGFVFVGTHRLEEMTTDYWSVLFNIALYRHIGYLDEEAAERLITEPVQPFAMVYDDLALHRMLQVTAGHPYFLQLLCYSLVNAHNRSGRSYTTVADVDQALEEILTLGGAHFSFLWETSSEEERATLLALTRLLPRLGLASWPQLGATPSDVALLLAERGLTMDPQAVSAALRNLASREILHEVPGDVERYVFRIGLLALWIEHYKSLRKAIEELA